MLIQHRVDQGKSPDEEEVGLPIRQTDLDIRNISPVLRYHVLNATFSSGNLLAVALSDEPTEQSGWAIT